MKVIVIIVIYLLLALCNGQNPSVNLTAEGGISLVGPHCPGTVRLFCEGMDLTSLRWTFNGSMEIETFFADSQPSNQTNTNNPAFLNVELRHVSRNGVRANFSSILTANLSALQSENIMEIACNGPFTLRSIPVNVDIERTPETPNITAVTAISNSGILTSVEVMWKNMDANCPIIYEVTLTGSDPVQATCAHDCVVTFDNLDSMVELYSISISAHFRGIEETSGLRVYSLELQSRQYFLTEVTTNDMTGCQIQGSCVSVEDLNTTCSVRSTTNSQYSDLSSNIGTPFSIPGLAPNTVYYLEFSSLNNESLHLLVVNRMHITTDGCNAQQVSVGIIFAAALVPIISILLIIVVIAIPAVRRVRISVLGRRKKEFNLNHQASEPPSQPDRHNELSQRGTPYNP